jgi:hypothetical protein
VLSQHEPSGCQEYAWWSPVRRGHAVIAVVAALAPTDQIAVIWPSRTPRRPANLWAVGDLGDLSNVRMDGPPLTVLDPPRFYSVIRHSDPSTISGTGLVAVCAEISPPGTVALAWIGQTTGHQTLTRLPSLRAVYDIHGHDGATELVPLPAELADPAPHPLPHGQVSR